MADFGEILNEDLVFVQKDFSEASEVIRFLSEQLLKRGYVKESFLPAVMEREEKFPTGLYLGKINVAIPHTELKHVIKPAIAIATLKKPVKWRRMDDPEEEIPVHIVFLLAIVNPKEYIRFLKGLIKSFSNKVLVQKIYSANNSKQILANLPLEGKKNKFFIESEVRYNKKNH